MTDALTQFFILLVERSLMAMPLAAIAYVLRCLPRVPKWMRMTLWLLVAVRLLIPWSIPSAWSAFNLVDAPIVNGGICASVSESNTPNALHYRQSSASVPSKADSAQTAETTAYSRQTADDGAVQKQTSRPALSVFLPIAAYIWLAGVIVLLGKALFGYAEFRRLLAASIPLRDNIRLCDGIETGFTVGLLHPRIYMPSSLKDKEPQFSQVLAHEQAHLQRGDHFWKLLALVLRSLYWFNPVLWLAFNLFCEDMELACDELVCRGMTHAERIDYSQTLRDQTLQEAYRSETDILSLNAAVCPLAFGEICLKKRIKAVLNYRKPTLLVLASAAVLYAAAAVLFLTDSSVVPCDFNEYSSDKISDVYTYYRPDDRRIEWNVIDLNSYGDELLKRLRSLKGTRIAVPDGRTPICELTVWGSGMEKIQIQTFDHNSSLTEIKYGDKIWRVQNREFARYIKRLCQEGTPKFRQDFSCMGYDGFYTEQSDIFRKNREYFIQTEAGPVKIGESCGHRTQHFTADRDGDGITELICKCHASLGSARWIRVFRRNGNVIKTGIVEWDTLKKKLTDCAWEKSNYPSLWTDYDPERRIFIVHYPVKIFSYESTDPNDTIDTDHGFWKEGNKVYHSVDKTAILDYGDFTWEDYAHL